MNRPQTMGTKSTTIRRRSPEKVVLEGPALEHRGDRQVRGEVAQLQEVGDGALLVLGDRGLGALEDVRLAHVVLLGGPDQAAGLRVVAANRGNILAGAVPVGAVAAQLGVPAGVQHPVAPGRLEGPAATTETPVGHHQRAEAGLRPQPARLGHGQPERKARLGAGLFEPSEELGGPGYIQRLGGLDARPMPGPIDADRLIAGHHLTVAPPRPPARAARTRALGLLRLSGVAHQADRVDPGWPSWLRHR